MTFLLLDFNHPATFVIVLVVTFLAIWRMTHAFMFETGPYAVLVKLRAKFGVTETVGADGKKVRTHTHGWTECFWCCSFWMTLILLLCPFIINIVLFLNAMAILIQIKVVRDN